MNWNRLRDSLRCLFLPRSHRRRIRAARRALRKIRPWLCEPSGSPRVFGYLRKVDALSFEELVLQCFVDMGWRVRRGTRYSGDGGVDGHVRLPFDHYWTAIQCKRYSSAIDPTHVREFAEIVYPLRGLFVHTGRTGQQSHQARGESVTMVSGDRLIALINGNLSLNFRGRSYRQGPDSLAPFERKRI